MAVDEGRDLARTRQLLRRLFGGYVRAHRVTIPRRSSTLEILAMLPCACADVWRRGGSEAAWPRLS